MSDEQCKTFCWHGREVISRPNPAIPGGKSYELVHASDKTPCSGRRRRG